MKATSCIHYNGILGGDILDKKAIAERRCEAGVLYADVKESGNGHGLRFPCVDSTRGSIVCPKHQYPTAEQVAEQKRQEREFIERLGRIMSGELRECVQCEATVDSYREVSPCVYAEPCGHRQWQGRAPKVKP